MWPLLLLLLTTVNALAVDDNALALALRSQSDFDRVELSAAPTLPETLACVQSQAMVLPVTRPAELSLIYYRKGYCELMEGTITKKQGDYREAARDFGKAQETWGDRVKRGVTPPAVSSGLRVLADAALLLANGNTDPRVTKDLEGAVSRPECAASDMPVSRCQELAEIGKLWLGWIAGREGRLADAAHWFEGAGETGWAEWMEGRQRMESREFARAVAAFGVAAKKFAWERSGLVSAIGPRTDVGDALFRLGMAEYEVKDYGAAIASFDRAVKAHPENARAFFLLGRAKEMTGQNGVADFDLASRTAFANVNAPGASGQAHLYKGVALYRRKDYPRAEQEFASALNFDAGAAQEDAAAWRHLAGVAGGSCGPSAALLAQSLGQASDYFPREEAESLLHGCGSHAISEVVSPAAR